MPPNVLPFRTHSFDSGILDNVLEHIVDPHCLLAEIRRVLKPRGIVLVGVPGERGYAWDLDHKVFYDAASLVSTMEICGFTHRRTFHVPFRSSTLSRLVRQYCIYATFVAT
jgi:SAM-dependent methyltransferase